MPELNDLLVLIRLLKAEGVKEYSNNGTTLSFFAAEPSDHQASGGVDSGEVAAASEAEAPDPTLAAPPVMRKLNPNYGKLVGYRNR